MPDDLPEPLTTPECDLRDFAFMPLDVQRLRDSDLAALESPEACWAAVLLWCVSWHQVPAASLPEDDRVLSRFLGYQRAPKDWQRIRAGALRGWQRCSDGRLYHPVVAQKAMEAWQSKLRQRWQTDCARIKKANQRNSTNHHLPTFEEWLSRRTPENVPRDNKPTSPGTGGECPRDVSRETPPKGQGEGQGQGQGESKSSLRSGVPRIGYDDPDFARFWALYPRKDAKADALKAWIAATRSTPASEILAGLGRYRFDPNPTYQKLPAGWLRDERWLEQQTTPPPAAPPSSLPENLKPAELRWAQ